MSGLNKVMIIGNLGNDPETRFMPSGGAVSNISVATSDKWKDKDTGEQKERTEWHRVVFFNRLAEVVGEYLRKGSKIYVEGALRTRKWQDKEGNDRWSTEIVASSMQMLDSRGSGQGGGYPSQGEYPEASQSHGQSNNGAPHGSAQGAPAQHDAPPYDDDIPF